MGRLNKPGKQGYVYRSPQQTNANDLTPNLREDTPASQRADNERIRRGLSADAAREYNRRLQQEAGGRAIMRTAGRAGLAGTALQGGYEVGRALDESTGVGRKLVDRAGSAIDRAASGDRVKLTPDAERRAKEEEDFQTMQRALREVDAERDRGYARGGSVTRADGCCKKGHTKGRMV